MESLLMFFDKVSILLPDCINGLDHVADRLRAEPLEDQGLLEVLEPKQWVDEEIVQNLAEAVNGPLANGVHDDLPRETHFREMSQSRIGFGANIDLAQSLVSQLQAKGLARPSEDGVSIPLHPVVRTTILLVILAQLGRSAGTQMNPPD